MEERLQFVRDALSDRFTMSELCARYSVSRRIGYKWLARYDADGRRGLADRSRAPRHCPHKIAPRLEETDDGIWAIHFNTVLLATFDERDYIIAG